MMHEFDVVDVLLGLLLGSFVALVFGLLIWGWRYWFNSIGERLKSHGQRLDTHDVKIAVVDAQLENIAVLSAETREDVRTLLGYANGGSERPRREG